jgi:hypothetical protein
MTQSIEGNRETPLTLKVLTGGTVFTASKASALLIKTMKPAVGKIGTKIAGKGAGSAAAKLAAKTGAKVGAKAGGKFLGPIIGVAIIIWNVWDHYATKAEQQPILRKNLIDFLAEVRRDLLKDPETGIMSIIDSIQTQIATAMIDAKSPA